MTSILAKLDPASIEAGFGVALLLVREVYHRFIKPMFDRIDDLEIERAALVNERDVLEDELAAVRAALKKRNAMSPIQRAEAIIADALKRLSAISGALTATNATESAEKLRQLLERLIERFRAAEHSARPDSKDLEGKIAALVRSLQSQDTSQPEPPTKERVSELVKKIREALQDFEKLLRGD